MKCNTTSTPSQTSRLCTISGRVGITLIAGLALFGAATSGAHAWGITWSDEFTVPGAVPYSGVWSYDLGGGGWGNNELETYVSSYANAHIISDSGAGDGQALQIEAQTDTNGNWYSARINTAGKHSFGLWNENGNVEGYVEYRCKFPTAGQGYWPAAWLLGNNIGSVGWPACGEVDIAEEVDSQENNHQSLHMPGWNPTVVWNVNNATTAYQEYGAYFTPTYITFNMNGANSATFSKGGGGTWEFTSGQTYFEIINLAIGGNFPGNPNSSTKDNGNFDVDYVREYH